MENREHYLKYFNFQPVKIETHYTSNGKLRDRPLTTVGGLIAAYKTAVAPRFDSTPTEDLFLHLPDAIDSKALRKECFYSVDETDTALCSGLALSQLSSIGLTDLNPLIIKSKNGIFKKEFSEYDWSYWSNHFCGALSVNETSKIVESDREVKFKSKPLVLYQNSDMSLVIGRLPDLKFQDFNIETEIQKSVAEFMNSTEYLGLLIGPTGCGKSHEIIRRAKMEFTIFIDAQFNLVSNEPIDLSLLFLKQSFESITNTWNRKNQDLPKLQHIAYAFIISRMFFLKYLKETYPDLTPTQFLIHQLFNSRAITKCFISLLSQPKDKLFLIRKKIINFKCLFCVDETNVLLEDLGDTIIQPMYGNQIQKDVEVNENENAELGTLSVLLHAITNGEFAKKIILTGNSSELWKIKRIDSLPCFPTILNQFTAWDNEMALNYVSSYVDIPQDVLESVLTDNYRPRILENFVHDLFCIEMNDGDSPHTRKYRIENGSDILDIYGILKESYDAVIHRFTRISIVPLARKITQNSHTEIMLKLLLCSMITSNGRRIGVQLNQEQENFFTQTIGSIYLIYSKEGYSFFEGYVINTFLYLFEAEFNQYNLSSSVNMLKRIGDQEQKEILPPKHHSNFTRSRHDESNG